MSIIKYYDIPTVDRYGNQSMVELSRDGMNKTASYENYCDEMRTYIANIKPKQGYAYLLISAMGDQNWGPNRNGDYWPTEALKNPGEDYGHKTYEIYGNWYHHHQNKDPNLSYGRVLKSVWNDDMGRIELIVEVDLQKDDKTRQALEKGETIETSMGAKVRYDICKICHPKWKEFYKIPEEEMIAISKEDNLDRVHAIGKKYGVDLSYITKLNPDGGPVGIHSNTTKYCKHMLEMRMQILPSGEQVCVINLRPRLFDISKVTRNADKSSFVLSKVASETVSGEHSEDIYDDVDTGNGIKAADQVESPGDGDIEKNVPDGQVIAEGLDDIERYYTENICPKMHLKEQEIPDRVIDELAEKHDLPSILSSFLAMGMRPHPREFQRIVMIQMGKRDELNKADADGDFLRMSDIPEVDPDQDLGGNVIGISPDKVDMSIMDVLKHFFWERSNYRKPLVKRMVIIKSASDNPFLNPNSRAPQERSIVPGLVASLGALYAISAIESKKKLSDVALDASALRNNRALVAKLGIAIVGAMALNNIIGRSQGNTWRESHLSDYRQKYAMEKGADAKMVPAKTLIKWVGPTLGTYMLGGHIINKAKTGRPVSKFEETIAKYPMESSVAATLLANYPGNIARGIKAVFKTAEYGLDLGEFDVDDLPLDERDAAGIAIWSSVNVER